MLGFMFLFALLWNQRFYYTIKDKREHDVSTIFLRIDTALEKPAQKCGSQQWRLAWEDRAEMGITMEIERKWMVSGWPEAKLPLLVEHSMRQGYLTVHPTVRIREEAVTGGDTAYVICFKSGSGLVRQEIELTTTREKFAELEEMIALPLIPKVRRTYALPDGMHLEVNHVDEGLPTEFWYAEVEYPSEEQARNWDPASVGLAKYLLDDVTDQPGQSMGAYWLATRGGQN